jgi:hypothetical protein
MSSVHLSEATTRRADLKHRDYGFVLVLACMVLGLVVASAIFKPAPVAALPTTKFGSLVLNSAEPRP